MTRRLAIPSALLTVLAFQACSDRGSPVEPNAECATSTAGLDFGQVAVGDSVDGSFLLRNRGRTVLEGSLASDSPEFTLVGPSGSWAIQPGDSLEVLVRFSPASQGLASGAITTGGLCAGVDCEGEGAVPTPGAVCDVAPTTLDFGPVEVGGFADRTFVVANTGPVSFSGNISSTCPDFSVASGAGPFNLAASESLVVTVRFAPTALGAADCAIRTGIDCGGVEASGEGAIPTSSVSFSSDIQPIFNVSCATTGCHRTPSPQVGLSLMSGQSWSQLVNVTATSYAPAVRVVPGDPGESVLYNKVADTGRFDGRMPPSGGLGAAEIDLIRAWILGGARND